MQIKVVDSDSVSSLLILGIFGGRYGKFFVLDVFLCLRIKSETLGLFITNVLFYHFRRYILKFK